VTIREFALLSISAIVISGCRTGMPVGDFGHGVTIMNHTSEHIIVYELGRDNRNYETRLGPNESRRNTWLVPPPGSPSRSAKGYQVDAFDLFGAHIYCERYSYDDLQEGGWIIRIIKGHINC
jgi:hypothetical protein